MGKVKLWGQTVRINVCKRWAPTRRCLSLVLHTLVVPGRQSWQSAVENIWCRLIPGPGESRIDSIPLGTRSHQAQGSWYIQETAIFIPQLWFLIWDLSSCSYIPCFHKSPNHPGRSSDQRLWDIVSDSLSADLDTLEVSVENSWLTGGRRGPRKHFSTHGVIVLMN